MAARARRVISRALGRWATPSSSPTIKLPQSSPPKRPAISAGRPVSSPDDRARVTISLKAARLVSTPMESSACATSGAYRLGNRQSEYRDHGWIADLAQESCPEDGQHA